MTLLEAFRTFGPVTGEPAVDAVRTAAADVLDGAVRRRAGFFRVPPEVRDDVVSDLLWKLLVAGPRGARDGEPKTDEGVEWWLRRSLTNQLIDWLRSVKRRRWGPLEDGPERADPRTPEHAMMQAYVEDLLNRARSVLLETSSGAHHEALTQMIDMLDGKVGFDAIVQRERGEVSKTTRNTVQQAHSRAKRHVRTWLTEQIAQGRIEPDTAAACESLLGTIGGSAARRVERRESRGYWESMP